MNRRTRQGVGSRHRRGGWRALLASVVATVVAGVAASGVVTEPVAASSVPAPTVSLPPVGTHGFPFLSEVVDLAGRGYVEEEVFIEGTASSYVPVNNLDGIADGRWDAMPTGPTASYKTRLLIRRPENPAKFNGTVVVDWLNVSAGFDIDVSVREIMREGYAYVGVSAQAVGVNFLRTWESGEGARYSSLVHPGDSYSYDIFSQAAQAIAHPNPTGPAPLGDLTSRIDALVASGGSQSGSRLFTYVNAVHPSVEVYDGFMIHITNSGAPLSQAPLPVVQPPRGSAAVIRTDSDDPVLYTNSETEFAAGARGIHSQPDSERFRLWEVPGSSHAFRQGAEDRLPQLAKSGIPGVLPECGDPPINDLDSRVAVNAGLHAMQKWLTRGRAPISAPRVQLSIPADPDQPAAIVRDPATGLATGGIRLPDVAVPTRTLSGERPPAALVAHPNCRLLGASDPWNGDSDAYDGDASLDVSPTPEPSLSALYKNEFRYVNAVRVSAWKLVGQGFLRPLDAKQIIDIAQTVDIP